MLLGTLAESPERDLRELELRQSVVHMQYVTKGYSAPETIEDTGRAMALAEKIGDLVQIGSWVRSRSVTAFMAGDLRNALTLSDRALELARREETATSLAPAYIMQEITRFWLGDLLGAEQHLANGRRYLQDPAFRQAFGAGVLPALGIASWNACILGRSDTARQRIAEMKAAANENNPFEAAMTGHHTAYLHILMKEYELAETVAAQAVEHSEKHQIPYFAATTNCMLGLSRAQLGGGVETVDLIRTNLAVLLEIGGIGITYFTSYQAEAQASIGAIVDALETVERAMLANRDEGACMPEILRLRGAIRLKLGQNKLAVADFRDSIAMARSMSAKAWELRTTMSLARLLTKQGKRDEARAMLADIYGWFTEGFDTADLKDAKALLEELST
jgi:tetratricopeptide (TPR) repeat protein